MYCLLGALFHCIIVGMVIVPISPYCLCLYLCVVWTSHVVPGPVERGGEIADLGSQDYCMHTTTVVVAPRPVRALEFYRALCSALHSLVGFHRILLTHTIDTLSALMAGRKIVLGGIRSSVLQLW